MGASLHRPTPRRCDVTSDMGLPLWAYPPIRISDEAHVAREVGGAKVDPKREPKHLIVMPRMFRASLVVFEAGGPMRGIITLLICFLAGSAAAHPGHLADVAGHGHWVGAAAIGLAILIGLIGKAKGEPKEVTNEETDETTEEAPA